MFMAVAFQGHHGHFMDGQMYNLCMSWSSEELLKVRIHDKGPAYFRKSRILALAGRCYEEYNTDQVVSNSG